MQPTTTTAITATVTCFSSLRRLGILPIALLLLAICSVSANQTQDRWLQLHKNYEYDGGPAGGSTVSSNANYGRLSSAAASADVHPHVVAGEPQHRQLRCMQCALAPIA